MAERKILYKIAPFVQGEKVVDADNVEIDASGFDGNLANTDTDVQAIAQKLDDLPMVGNATTAAQVSQVSTNQNGLLAGALNQQVANDRIDATGIGASIISFTGSFIATDNNLNDWSRGRQTVVMEHTSGGTNALRTFTLPGFDGLNAMFDLLQARGVAELFTITIGYQGGSTQFINRNALTVRAPSVSVGFDRTEIPVTIASGSSVTFRIERVGATINPWERISSQESPSSVDTFGDMEFQTLPFNNANDEFLPPSAAVQKGYAFKVIGSTPNDGTLRQGLVDSGVTDKVIYDDDWVVWIADSFTSWLNGDDWFVLAADDVRRISQVASNFLTNVVETDNKGDLGNAEDLGAANALVWLSPVQMVLPPFLNSNTDTNNPRANASGERYYGGTFNRNGRAFQFGGNLFNHQLYIGITPSFVLAHGVDNIDIVVSTDGDEVQRHNLSTFTLLDDANFTNGTVNHYIFPTTFNYASLETINIVLTQVNATFNFNRTIDTTPNVSNLQREQLSSDIDSLLKKIDSLPTNTGNDFTSIIDRISPYRNLQINTPDTDVYYRAATSAGESFPSDLTGLTQVNPDNPRFPLTTANLFLFVEGGSTLAYTIQNITQNTSFPLDRSLPNIEIGVSFVDNNKTYFGYRITGLTISDVLEVDNFRLEQVVAWQDDINNLIKDINRIDAELKHAALNLPDDLVQVLDNEVDVTEETNPTIIATDYNKSFSTNDTQTIFYETTPNAVGSGVLNSKPISETTGVRARRKLVYLPSTTPYVNGALITAFDGTTIRNLVEYQNGVFNAIIFVPGTSAGSQTITVTPSPSNLVARDWYSIPLHTSNLVAEADELFLTRDVPTTATTLNIQYRYDANGGHGATQTTTLVISDINQDANQFVNLALPDGENVSVGINWDATNRRIRITGTPQASNPNFFIFDMEVGITFEETRVIPATSASTRSVRIEDQAIAGQDNVFAIKPSATNTLVIVGDEREVDTGYLYTTLFDSDESGYLTIPDTGIFLDYQNFSPSASTLIALEQHATLPQFGLFSTEYTHATIVNFDTQLTVRNEAGDKVDVGKEVIAIAPDSTRWRLIVDNSGNITTVQVT